MIELLEPTGLDTPVGKFIAKRGIGIQQICFQVDDIMSLIDKLMAEDITMIDTTPRLGAKLSDSICSPQVYRRSSSRIVSKAIGNNHNPS